MSHRFDVIRQDPGINEFPQDTRKRFTDRSVQETGLTDVMKSLHVSRETALYYTKYLITLTLAVVHNEQQSA